MLFYGQTAARASQEVGYDSPTQFNREYKRFFFQPPHRDVFYTKHYHPPVHQPLSLNYRY
jgi:AraC-like DNA-binding protein